MTHYVDKIVLIRFCLHLFSLSVVFLESFFLK